MKYTISIVTYTAIEEAKRCVKSVLRHSRDFKLILTANGSDAAWNYFHAVSMTHKNVTVRKNGINEGFIEPNRVALEMCDTPYFVLLNDDCEVTRDWLKKLEQPFLKYPNAVLSGPAYGCCSLRDNLDGYTGPFEYLEGSCLMCKADIVKKHGLFSPYVVHSYAEDSDLSLRMRRLGYTLHQVNVSIHHKRQSTSRVVNGIRDIRLRNQAEVARRFQHYLKVRTFGYPITVVRRGAIGDVLLTTPIVEALAKQNPLSKIYVETDVEAVYRDNPFVTQVSRRIRLKDKTEQRITLDMAYENRPEASYLRAYADVAGLDGPLPMAKVYTNDHERTWAIHKLADRWNAPWCAIHAGPSWPGRTWDMKRWERVICHLHTVGFAVVLVGGKNDISLFDLDLRGQTTFHQLAALLARCELFIGIDSLPLHLANIANVPTIGLFGISRPSHVFSNLQNAYDVTSRLDHPETGARHRVAGKTMIHVQSNPMDTIEVEDVTGKIDEVTQ